ncbi:uncharacterized protein LOC114411149 [Glycine soja]|uniref:uncharacterized protein n=1 Tax=Glycine max TaxID=3847 RepID=UPI0007194088|nr:uncharacterized protein LOC106798811 [Glycine max]XP_028230707.1 uncharacterized protein LOC114411149 [Glycine soja]|eukprot:XP_014631472.1 uncharacterized protein LOC106798811 [Glycine max]
MIRTRGLGRAFARVIGKGMGRQDEHHANDVPRQHRPMVSAHRQRVHVVVAEDVPHMTEDVPHMTVDVATPGVEGLAGDGAEGSPADDAEGFPGGPRDSSERPKLKLVSHGRKVEKFGRPTPEIEGLVTAIGLTPLIGCLVVTGDPGVISAFVESWHKETSTFHLPVGELTITLDDVASLLHLSITSAFHSFEPLPMNEAVMLLMELLEVSGEEARAETSATHVHVVHLEAFQDLGQSGGYAWGAVVLVYMYDQLNEASQTTTRQIAGYRLYYSVHDCVTDDGYDETSPRTSRWLTTKAHMKGVIGALYRTRLDALTIADDGCEGCEAITERLKRVLNLRMVTEGINLHQIMEDCLRITRGDTSDGNVRAR